jgi:hypothetical protein
MGLGMPMRHPAYILGRPSVKEPSKKLGAGMSASGSVGANADNSYGEYSHDHH